MTATLNGHAFLELCGRGVGIVTIEVGPSPGQWIVEYSEEPIQRTVEEKYELFAGLYESFGGKKKVSKKVGQPELGL
jgi:hypothetical protein